MKTHAFHIGLHVKDIRETVRFYSSLLGQEPLKIKDDYAKYELEDPALVLTFNQSKSGILPGFGHLGFRATNEEQLADFRLRVLNAGIEVLDEEDTACCYARQDKFWVSDPDGYRWEVFLFKGDVEVNDVRENACCDDTCCAA